MVGREEVELNSEKNKRPKKQVLIHWEERTVEDSFSDVQRFGRDLAQSLENRVESCVNDVGKANFFDIEETFQFLCGERLANDQVKIQEGDLEMFGAETFRQFFHEVCCLKHIKALNNQHFDERLFLSTLRQWKNAVRHLVWEKAMKNKLIPCLKPVKDEYIHVAAAVGTDPEAKLLKMTCETETTDKVNLHKLFAFEFTNHPTFQAEVEESKVVSLLYTDETLYDITGSVSMTAFDIAMSLGGSEAIVESLYSVMDTQRKVRQHHTTLEDRTILDWSISNVLNVEDIVSRAARLYIDGSSALKLPRHRVGRLKKKNDRSYEGSQVLTRLKREKGRYSYLT